MTAPATDIPSVKKFLVELAGVLKDPYTRVKPYLIMDNHGAHRSDKIREELSRFHPCWQAPYSSPFNCQETVWSLLKREWLVRLHRRETDLANEAQFRDMVHQLCDEVAIDHSAILRANHDYIAHYLALGDELSSDSY